MFMKPNFGKVHANKIERIQQGIEGLIEGHPDHYSVHVLPTALSIYPAEIRQDVADFIEVNSNLRAQSLGALILMYKFAQNPESPERDIDNLESVQKVLYTDVGAAYGRSIIESYVNHAHLKEEPLLEATSWQLNVTSVDQSTARFRLVSCGNRLIHAQRDVHVTKDPELRRAHEFIFRNLDRDDLQLINMLVTGRVPETARASALILVKYSGHAFEDELVRVLDFIQDRAESVLATEDEINTRVSVNFSETDLDEAIELIDSL